MKSVYVAELAVGDDVSELFAVRSVDLKEYTGGKMVSLELVDRTGRIKGIIWEGSADLMRNLKADRVYKIRGSVTTYKGENQITVTAIEPCEEFDPDDFLPGGDLSYEELEKKLTEAIKRVKDSDYRGLLDDKLWHHNYVGGLAEHSLSMFELCRGFCENYEELDPDLILTGALLHDTRIMKSWTRI
jgi:3'-5' exoribonuclease